MKKITGLDIKRQELGLTKDLSSQNIYNLYKNSNTKKKLSILSVIEILKFNETNYSQGIDLIFKNEQVNSLNQLIKKISSKKIEDKIKEENNKIIKLKKKNKLEKPTIRDLIYTHKIKVFIGIWSLLLIIVIIPILNKKDSSEILIKTENSLKTKKTINLTTINGQKYIYLVIDGIRKEFLLDTGASDLLISKSFLNQLVRRGFLTRRKHFITYRNYEVASGEIITAEVWKIPQLSIGSIKLLNVNAGAIDGGSFLFGMSALDKLGKTSIDLESDLIIID